MSKFAKGDTAYILDTGSGWIQVQILRVTGTYYTVKRMGGKSGFGASEHRLLTVEEFKTIEVPPKPIRSPDPH